MAKTPLVLFGRGVCTTWQRGILEHGLELRKKGILIVRMVCPNTRKDAGGILEEAFVESEEE